ncbi:hypothetical protein, partial [Flavobacterium sp.]|uniref:hypothetical protein n=1 Tax=Flavobacterium sp. TaxID=239 RepID=UPI0025C135EF
QRGLLLPRRKSNKRARGTTDFGDLTALEIRELKELAETFWVREPFWVAQTAFNLLRKLRQFALLGSRISKTSGTRQNAQMPD